VKAIILFFLLTGILRVTAQQKVFTEDELIAVIMKFHPVARQAVIDIKIAKTEILSGRGAFDPRFTRETARKEFDGINYYRYQINEIQIPTWYGIDLYTGIENIAGDRVNPEQSKGSLTYLGFSIQPLQNLVMDKRRATLLQAKNFHQLSEVQRRVVINDLLKEALFSYWDWWEKYHIQQIVVTGLSNAEKRMALVRKTFQLGERPAIDTLEAYIQVQSFQIRLSEAFQNLIKANLELSAFLWTKDGGKAELDLGVIPQDDKHGLSFSLADLLSQAVSHPELVQFDYKLKGLHIDKRLAFQSVLPALKIKYNQMGYDLSKAVNASWFDNNYRYGVSVSIPLRFSEGRSAYQKTNLKIESTRLDQANKQVQLFTKVKQYYNEWQQTEAQLSLQQKLLANTRALQKGEEIKFANGESSLFLINIREQKTIEAEEKTIDLKAKTKKAGVGVRWSAGILVSDL